MNRLAALAAAVAAVLAASPAFASKALPPPPGGARPVDRRPVERPEPPPEVTQPAPPPAKGDQPLVQLALLLDTSGSMDGLIAQAKTQLWKVVNEFARSERGGKAPRLEVALYEYGNDGLPAQKGYLRQIVPLTTDLDRVSAELFKLATNGGSEHCGQVIDTATRELSWSGRKDAVKMIFIAGNEPFTQGPIDWRAATKKAIGKGITVNTIFCGAESDGVATGWKDGALVADGRFLSIDANVAVAHVTAPQDSELARLSAKLNETYVAYGRSGAEKKKRQVEQDQNAASAGQGASVTRAAAKASAQYKNDDWDLVDAAKEGKVSVDALSEAELPAELRGKDAEAKKAHVAKLAAERSELQAKIRKLEDERRTYVAAEEAKAPAAPATLDKALVDTVRAQAAEAGFAFH